MNKIVLSITILMIMSITTYAEDVNKQGDTFLKTIDGYIRLGYQQDDEKNKDLALGVNCI